MSRRRAGKVSYAEFMPAGDAPTQFSDEDDFKPPTDDEDDEEVEEEDLKDEEPEVVDLGSAESEPEPEPEPVARVTKATAAKKTQANPPKTRPNPASQSAPPVLQKPKNVPPVPQKKVYTAEKVADRFRFFFGNDNLELVKAIETRIDWATVAFTPEQQILDKDNRVAPIHEPQARQKTPITAMLEQTSPEVVLGGYDILLEQNLLQAGETRDTEQVILLNAGRFVKEVKWAPYGTDTQMIAVSLIDSEHNPIDSNAADPEISAYADATGSSLLHFYSMNMSSQKVVPWAIINCGNRGPISKMRWRPVDDSSELAVLFQDGTIALVPMPDQGTFDAAADSVISLDVRISAFDWRNEDYILCGTVDGYVAQFDVHNHETPLFYSPLHISIITDLSASFPSQMETFCTTSADGETRVTDVENLARSISITRSRAYVATTEYLPALNVYVTQDDHLLTRMVLAHNPSYPSGTQLTTHEGSVTAIGTSRFHPFVLSGSADGTVQIVNASRRALAPRRSLKDEKSLTLWELQVEERTRRYHITEKLEITPIVSKHKVPTLIPQLPKTVSFTCIDWNQSRQHASWYCACTAGGLLRIEKLA